MAVSLVLCFIIVPIYFLRRKSPEIDGQSDLDGAWVRGISWGYMVIYTLFSALMLWIIWVDDYNQATGTFVIYQMHHGYGVEYYKTHSYFETYMKYVFQSGRLITTVLQVLEFVFALVCWGTVLTARIGRRSINWPYRLLSVLSVCCLVTAAFLAAYFINDAFQLFETGYMWKREFSSKVTYYLALLGTDLAGSSVPLFFTMLMSAATGCLSRRTAQ